MSPSKRLFGADGIRGAVDYFPIRPQDADRLGQATAAWLHELGFTAPACLIANDTRESSQRLKQAFARGLAWGGVRVVDAGLLPTAAVSYLLARKGTFACGAVISASHNPVDDNGIKLFDRDGLKLSDAAELQIEQLVFGQTDLASPTGPGSITQDRTCAREYVESLVETYKDLPWHALRVVIDLANGAASQVYPCVLDKLGLSYVVLNADPDGTNINEMAGSEYVRRNPDDLARQVRRYGAQVGLALDGDADRVVLVDREGLLYDGDRLLAILALQLAAQGRLARHTIVVTKISNTALTDYLARRAVHTQRVENGDKHLAAALVGEGLRLGGEEVGHVILHTDRCHVTGDGLRTALQVLTGLLDSPTRRLRDLAPGFRKYPQVRLTVQLPRRTDRQVTDIPGLASLKQAIEADIPDLTRPIECSPATTEPLYRIMLESRTATVRELAEQGWRLANYIRNQLAGPDCPIEALDCTQGGLIDLTAPDFRAQPSRETHSRCLQSNQIPSATLEGMLA